MEEGLRSFLFFITFNISIFVITLCIWAKKRRWIISVIQYDFFNISFKKDKLKYFNEGNKPIDLMEISKFHREGIIYLFFITNLQKQILLIFTQITNVPECLLKTWQKKIHLIHKD